MKSFQAGNLGMEKLSSLKVPSKLKIRVGGGNGPRSEQLLTAQQHVLPPISFNMPLSYQPSLGSFHEKIPVLWLSL